MVESAKECMKQKASKSEIYGKMQQVFIEMDSTPVVSPLVMKSSLPDTECFFFLNYIDKEDEICLVPLFRSYWDNEMYFPFPAISH